MKILITGFDPFGGEKVNPSFEAIKLLPDVIEDATIIKVQIPTVFKKSYQVLREEIVKHSPDIVVCVGQAGGTNAIRIERVAINIDDARIADNEGNQPIDERIFEAGENAYFSTLPVKGIVDENKKDNIPCIVSNTAGTYVCNHIFYSLMYGIAKDFPNIRGGFIHVPYIKEQVKNIDTPFMELEDITRGLKNTVIASLKYSEDIKVTGGLNH